MKSDDKRRSAEYTISLSGLVGLRFPSACWSWRFLSLPISIFHDQSMVSSQGIPLSLPSLQSIFIQERPFAIGFVTGGRQIGRSKKRDTVYPNGPLSGSLLILPVAGVLCSNASNGFGGWPAIFYLSGRSSGQSKSINHPLQQ